MVVGVRTLWSVAAGAASWSSAAQRQQADQVAAAASFFDPPGGMAARQGVEPQGRPGAPNSCSTASRPCGYRHPLKRPLPAPSAAGVTCRRVLCLC